MRALILLPLLALALTGCDHGNVKPVADYSAPPPPPLHDPTYNPYTPYGDANATWTPPTYDTDGTIAKPTEPSSQADRPPYETAPWATGAQGGSQYAPPGTF
jgi:hypothetical protein